LPAGVVGFLLFGTKTVILPWPTRQGKMIMEHIDPPVGAFVGATVVLFNGPPHSGKDTAGNFMHSITPHSRIVKFAGNLKRSTHMDFGLPPEIPDDYFEKCKDLPNAAFFGQTPRQAYIDKSEKRQKPFLGKDIYGRTLLRSMWRDYQEGVKTFYVTDSGFDYEAVPILEAIGKENYLLVRIHAEKRRCSFKKDSRSYIDLAEVATYNVGNNTTQDDFTCELRHLIMPFVAERVFFTEHCAPDAFLIP
jgi:hypothetical protein